MLLAGMDAAFDRAVAADSLSGLERLLAEMEKAGIEPALATG